MPVVSKPTESEVKKATTKLNSVLTVFSMTAEESWSKQGFERWYIQPKSIPILNLIVPQECVASMGWDLEWFNVNPDGPFNDIECIPLERAIAEGFGKEFQTIGRMMSSQGGR